MGGGGWRRPWDPSTQEFLPLLSALTYEAKWTLDLPRHWAVRACPWLSMALVAGSVWRGRGKDLIACYVVKVDGEDLATPGSLRGHRARRYVGNFRSWVRSCTLTLSQGNPETVTIPQYRFNKTKQHTQSCKAKARKEFVNLSKERFLNRKIEK